MDADFFELRRCLREPISDIFHAAHLIDRAVGAHLAGEFQSAEEFIRAANLPTIRAWTESLWGSAAANPDQWKYRRFRTIAPAPPALRKAERIQQRMPSAPEKRMIIDRYGRNCVFCGIPLIRKEIQIAIRRVYPDALPWGSTNATQHAAFQCMWMQFDHILPHCRGGDSSLENIVVSCAPCNYGRGDCTLEEVGLVDPRKVPLCRTSWEGLERFLYARWPLAGKAGSRSTP